MGDSISDSVSGAASEATHVLGLSFNKLAQNTQYKRGEDIGKGIAAKVAAQSKKDADAKAATRSKMPEMAQSDDKAAKELSQQRLQERLNDPIINPKLNPDVAAQPKVAAAAKSGAAEQGQPKGAEVYKYIYYRSPNGTIFKFGIFKDVPQFPNKILIKLSPEQIIGSESSTGKFMIDLQKKNIPEASVSQASSSHITITLHLNQPQFDLLQTAADNNRQWTLTPANVANAPITFPGTWHSDENSAMKKEKLSEAAADYDKDDPLGATSSSRAQPQDNTTGIKDTKILYTSSNQTKFNVSVKNNDDGTVTLTFVKPVKGTLREFIVRDNTLMGHDEFKGTKEVEGRGLMLIITVSEEVYKNFRANVLDKGNKWTLTLSQGNVNITIPGTWSLPDTGNDLPDIGNLASNDSYVSPDAMKRMGVGFDQKYSRGGKRRRHTIKKNRRSIRRTTIRRRQYKNNNKKNRSFKK